MKTGKSAAAAWMLYLLMVIMLFLFLAPFGIVFFNSLKHMRMMTADKIRAFINGKSSQCHLVAVRNLFLFISPVEDHNGDHSALFFYFGNILF